MPQTHSIYTSPQNCITHSRFNPERLTMYLGKTGTFEEVIPPSPSILFRRTKGQALTHTEMDANLCSFLLTCSMTNHLSGTVAHGEGPDWGTASWYIEQSDQVDGPNESTARKKDAKYKAQFENAFITLSYASCSVYDQNGTPVETWQYSHSVVKVQHTTPEILGMISNEYLTGSFEIQKNFKVEEGNVTIGCDKNSSKSSIRRRSGDLIVRNHLFVSEEPGCTGSLDSGNVKKTSVLSKKTNPNSTTITESKEIQAWIEHTCSVDVLEARTNAIVNNITASNDVYIQGNLHVDGTIWGNWIDPNYRYTGPSAHVDWDPSSSVAIISDARVKENVVEILPSTSLKRVLSLNPVEFDWKPESLLSGSGRGLIAQDVLAVDPKLVVENDIYLKVKYLDLIPDLINCIKELRKEINELKAQQNKP